MYTYLSEEYTLRNSCWLACDGNENVQKVIIPLIRFAKIEELWNCANAIANYKKNPYKIYHCMPSIYAGSLHTFLSSLHRALQCLHLVDTAIALGPNSFFFIFDFIDWMESIYFGDKTIH